MDTAAPGLSAPADLENKNNSELSSHYFLGSAMKANQIKTYSRKNKTLKQLDVVNTPLQSPLSNNIKTEENLFIIDDVAKDDQCITDILLPISSLPTIIGCDSKQEESLPATSKANFTSNVSHHESHTNSDSQVKEESDKSLCKLEDKKLLVLDSITSTISLEEYDDLSISPCCSLHLNDQIDNTEIKVNTKGFPLSNTELENNLETSFNVGTSIKKNVGYTGDKTCNIVSSNVRKDGVQSFKLLEINADKTEFSYENRGRVVPDEESITYKKKIIKGYENMSDKCPKTSDNDDLELPGNILYEEAEEFGSILKINDSVEKDPVPQIDELKAKKSVPNLGIGDSDTVYVQNLIPESSNTATNLDHIADEKNQLAVREIRDNKKHILVNNDTSASYVESESQNEILGTRSITEPVGQRYSVSKYLFNSEKESFDASSNDHASNAVSRLIGRNKRYYNMLGSKLSNQPFPRNKPNFNAQPPHSSISATSQNADITQCETVKEGDKKSQIAETDADPGSDTQSLIQSPTCTKITEDLELNTLNLSKDEKDSVNNVMKQSNVVEGFEYITVTQSLNNSANASHAFDDSANVCIPIVMESNNKSLLNESDIPNVNKLSGITRMETLDKIDFSSKDHEKSTFEEIQNDEKTFIKLENMNPWGEVQPHINPKLSIGVVSSDDCSKTRDNIDTVVESISDVSSQDTDVSDFVGFSDESKSNSVETSPTAVGKDKNEITNKIIDIKESITDGLGKRQRKKRSLDDFVDPFNYKHFKELKNDTYDGPLVKKIKLENNKNFPIPHDTSDNTVRKKRGRPSLKSLQIAPATENVGSSMHLESDPIGQEEQQEYSVIENLTPPLVPKKRGRPSKSLENQNDEFFISTKLESTDSDFDSSFQDKFSPNGTNISRKRGRPPKHRQVTTTSECVNLEDICAIPADVSTCITPEQNLREDVSPTYVWLENYSLPVKKRGRRPKNWHETVTERSNQSVNEGSGLKDDTYTTPSKQSSIIELEGDAVCKVSSDTLLGDSLLPVKKRGRPLKDVDDEEKMHALRYYDTGEEILSVEDKQKIAHLFEFLKLPHHMGVPLSLLTSSKMVRCGKCNEYMKMGYYQQYHRVKHYYLCWLDGEPPLDVYDTENTIRLLKHVLSKYAQAKRLVRFQCEHCSSVSKSPYGYASHLLSCNNLTNQKSLFKVETVKKETGLSDANDTMLQQFTNIASSNSSLKIENYGATIFRKDTSPRNLNLEKIKSKLNSNGKMVSIKGNGKNERNSDGNGMLSEKEKREITCLFTFLKKPRHTGVPPTLLNCSKMVKCGVCQKEMMMGYYQQYHRVKHYYLCWLDGEPAIDLNNTDIVIKLLKSMLAPYAQFKKLVRFKCDECQHISRTPFGYARHRATCDKFYTCPLCEKEMPLANASYHNMVHSRKLQTPASSKRDKEPLITKKGADVEEQIGIKRKRKMPNRLITEYSLIEKKKNGERLKVFDDYSKEEVANLNDFIAEHEKYWEILQHESLLHCVGYSCQYMCTEVSTMIEHFWSCSSKVFLYSCNSCSFSSHYEDNMKQHKQICGNKRDNNRAETVQPDYVNDINEISDISDTNEDDEDRDKTFEVAVEAESSSDDDIVSDNISNDENNNDDDGDDDVDEDDDHNFKPVKTNNRRDRRDRRDRVYRASRPFVDVIEENRKIRNKIYSKEPTIPSIVPQNDNWNHSLEEEVFLEYVPILQTSACISFNNDVSFRQFTRFQSDIVSGVPIMFTGGPIHAIAWLTLPDDYFSRTCDQYLAVACHPHMDHKFQMNKTYQFASLIQLWRIPGLHNLRSVVDPPVFSLGIAHHFGAVWCMEWTPSGGYDNWSNHRRIGVLAVATSSGNIVIYSIPFPDSVPASSSKLKIVKPEPDLILKLHSGEEEVQCTRVTWDKCSPHTTIFGGYSNGTVAIWDISTTLPLLKQGNIIYPHTSFLPHNRPITALSVNSVDGCRYLLTGSLKSSINYWDLNEKLVAPWRSYEMVYPITDSAWMPHTLSSVTVCDQIGRRTDLQCIMNFAEGNMTDKAKILFSKDASFLGYIDKSAQIVKRGDEIFGCLAKRSNSPATLCVSISPWTNSAAACTDNGTVAVALSIRTEQQTSPVTKVILDTSMVRLKSEDDDEIPHSVDKKHPSDIFFNPDSFSYITAESLYGVRLFTDSKEKKNEKRILSSHQLSSVNKVCWNPNITSFQWLAVGHQCGFLQIYKADCEADNRFLRGEKVFIGFKTVFVSYSSDSENTGDEYTASIQDSDLK